MRLLVIVVLLALVSFAVVSCETQASDEPTDAGLDQQAPTCASNADCANGLACAYPIQVGCSAKGECRDFSADAEGCTVATTACGCDGKTVDIPACWMSFAPAPVLSSGQPTCNGDL